MSLNTFLVFWTWIPWFCSYHPQHPFLSCTDDVQHHHHQLPPLFVTVRVKTGLKIWQDWNTAGRVVNLALYLNMASKQHFNSYMLFSILSNTFLSLHPVLVLIVATVFPGQLGFLGPNDGHSNLSQVDFSSDLWGTHRITFFYLIVEPSGVQSALSTCSIIFITSENLLFEGRWRAQCS